MNAQTLATTCFAAFNAEQREIHLQIFTLDGTQHTFTLTDLDTLILSATRARKAAEEHERNSALLIKSQPVGVRLGSFDV